MRPPPFTLVSCVTEPRRSVRARARGIADTNRRVTANSDKSYRIRRTRYVYRLLDFRTPWRFTNYYRIRKYGTRVRNVFVLIMLYPCIYGRVDKCGPVHYTLSSVASVSPAPLPPRPTRPAMPPQARRHAPPPPATQPSPAHAHPWCSRAFGSSPSDGALVPSVQAHKRPDAGTEVAQIVAWTQPSTH